MNNEHAACPCAGDWPETEARYYQAKQALLSNQQRHCAAASFQRGRVMGNED